MANSELLNNPHCLGASETFLTIIENRHWSEFLLFHAFVSKPVHLLTCNKITMYI